MIYLDNAATTQIHKRVLDVMLPYLKDQYGNPGSVYQLGRAAKEAVNRAREQVAAFINAEPEQIIFTSGGSEANSLAIRGTAPSCRKILTSHVEHDSVLQAIAASYYPSDRLYCSVTEYDGSFVLEAPSDAFDGAPIDMASLMLTNNEVNISYGDSVWRALGEMSGANAIIHGDAVQALGKRKIDVKGADDMYDMLSLSGHKIHAPKGVGALFVRDKSIICDPQIRGSGKQEFGLRAGTENVAAIVGFGEACAVAHYCLSINEKIVPLARDSFQAGLRKEADRLGIADRIHRNGDDSGWILSYTIDGIDAESLILMCAARGLCISAGAACNDLSNEPSHVLHAIGLTDEQARSTVRVSFSALSEDDESWKAGQILAESIKILSGGV